jgi:hypothetical protein
MTPSVEVGDLVRVRDWPGIGYEKYVVRRLGSYENEPWATIIEQDEVSPVRTVHVSHLKVVKKGAAVAERPKETNKRATRRKRGA